MPKKPPGNTPEEETLLAKLRRHPDLQSSIERILELADDPENAHKSADEIEEMLVEQVRRLGAQTMKDWAQNAEAEIGSEMQNRKPATYRTKKNE